MLVDVYCDATDCSYNVDGECRRVDMRIVKSHKCSDFDLLEVS